jgi:thiosulfate/3-mercaptopyruvate sulfurtransferase
MMQSFLLLVALSYARPELVVSTDWLAEHLDDPDIVIVDTRTRGYGDSHIPGAVHLDIATSRDRDNPPDYLPDLDTFVATLEELGISNDSHVIFYDDRGGIYGTRPWVLMRMLGLTSASIVDGGWPKWVSESRPTSSGPPEVTRGSIVIDRDNDWISVADDVQAAISDPGVKLLDARTADEFSGEDLRSNPRGGAIPSATHLFWEESLAGEFQQFRSGDELAALFESRGIDSTDEIITYCQGGGRAAHELFMLYLMGYENVSLYLGSMEDWSRQPERPLH